MRKIMVLLFLAMALSNVAWAQRVCQVHDGDTFKLCNGQSIRVWGVDAPELKQPLGITSRNFLNHLIDDQTVHLLCVGKSYRRKVCMVQLHHQDVGKDLVEQGYAYESREYSGTVYTDVENIAKSQHLGVWSLPDGGVRPWVYRSENR